MKRLLALLLTLLCAVGAASAEPEKYEAMPAIFAVTVEENERKIDEGSAYVYKEYVTTTNPDVNAELRAIVDAYDREFSPTLQPDPAQAGEARQRAEHQHRLLPHGRKIPEHAHHRAREL